MCLNFCNCLKSERTESLCIMCRALYLHEHAVSQYYIVICFFSVDGKTAGCDSLSITGHRVTSSTLSIRGWSSSSSKTNDIGKHSVNGELEEI